MPMVKKLLEKISGKEITYKVDPDTAVAQGAAIFASTLSTDSSSTSPGYSIVAVGEKSGLPANIVVSDVTSQSLGVITVSSEDENKEVNTIIIPHNTKIPTKKSEIAYTLYDNQQEIKIEVTEGDDTDVEFVKIIGSSILSMPPYPKGSPVEIVYAYDPDQTIYVEVIDKVSNTSLGTFEIDRTSNLSESEVKHAMGIVTNASVD